MLGANRLLLAAVTCLGVVTLLLACGPAQPAGTEPPAGETPEPATGSLEPATATPAAPANSPLPTPDREARQTPGSTGLPELVPGLTAETKPLPELAPAITPGPPVTGEAPAALLDAILVDLAGRLGVSADAIEVVRDEAVVWNDGSLGCPEPGMMYTQALVDGYWVVLEYGDQSYDYRASEGGYFRLCENAGAMPGIPGGGETE